MAKSFHISPRCTPAAGAVAVLATAALWQVLVRGFAPPLLPTALIAVPAALAGAAVAATIGRGDVDRLIPLPMPSRPLRQREPEPAKRPPSMVRVNTAGRPMSSEGETHPRGVRSRVEANQIGLTEWLLAPSPPECQPAKQAAAFHPSWTYGSPPPGRRDSAGCTVNRRSPC
jgi:hypothetical protein